MRSLGCQRRAGIPLTAGFAPAGWCRLMTQHMVICKWLQPAQMPCGAHVSMSQDDVHLLGTGRGRQRRRGLRRQTPRCWGRRQRRLLLRRQRGLAVGCARRLAIRGACRACCLRWACRQRRLLLRRQRGLAVGCACRACCMRWCGWQRRLLLRRQRGAGCGVRSAAGNHRRLPGLLHALGLLRMAAAAATAGPASGLHLAASRQPAGSATGKPAAPATGHCAAAARHTGHEGHCPVAAAHSC